jgi:muramoyltetrapeptide carboxypeptidase
MNRKAFNRLLLAGFGLAVSGCTPKLKAATFPTDTTRVKPRRLQQNDLVSLISPGSYIDDEGLQRAVKNLETLGFRVKLGKHIREQYGYVAGSDKQRLEDLHDGFADDEVKAVWCVRGGYGCSRLLPYIDYALIRSNPKALIGYSDITALLNAIYLKTGLVGFHGPVGASELTDYNRLHLEAVLMDGKNPWLIQRPATYGEQTDQAYLYNKIRSGQAEGILVGGNLSLLAAMAGSGFLPDLGGHLVFMEEVGEKPYRVDRMLTQLRQAGNLQAAGGIALGVFSGCEAGENDRSLTLPQTLEDRLGEFKCPVAYGFPFGHISDQCTLPVGIRARMDAGEGTIQLLEAAVS